MMNHGVHDKWVGIAGAKMTLVRKQLKGIALYITIHQYCLLVVV